jgi:hypothetical protein
MKELYSNDQRGVSVAGRQIDTRPFVDLVKRIKAFPATECACEGLFCQLRNLVGDFRHQMSNSMIVDLLVIKTRVISPDAGHIKEWADALSEVQSGTRPYKTPTEYHNTWVKSLV